jgi:hypothetical protein
MALLDFRQFFQAFFSSQQYAYRCFLCWASSEFLILSGVFVPVTEDQQPITAHNTCSWQAEKRPTDILHQFFSTSVTPTIDFNRNLCAHFPNTVCSILILVYDCAILNQVLEKFVKLVQVESRSFTGGSEQKKPSQDGWIWYEPSTDIEPIDRLLRVVRRCIPLICRTPGASVW